MPKRTAGRHGGRQDMYQGQKDPRVSGSPMDRQKLDGDTTEMNSHFFVIAVVA